MLTAIASLILLPAVTGPAPAGPSAVRPVSSASCLLMDARTGAVLHEQQASRRRAPASLVKMMVELILLEEIEAGRLALADSVTASAHASTMGGSQVFLAHNERQTVHALLQALVIASANDASVALAEHVAGSEAAFVERMNARARGLGCRATRFTNVHGLDLYRQERAYTTAHDLAVIARALVGHPLALELASTRRAPFRGGAFWLDTTNKLLGKGGVDGLKTGWTPRAGGCFCATAERNGVRLISVVLGAQGGRFHVTERLLEDGFRVALHEAERARDDLPVELAGGPSR